MFALPPLLRLSETSDNFSAQRSESLKHFTPTILYPTYSEGERDVRGEQREREKPVTNAENRIWS